MEMSCVSYWKNYGCMVVSVAKANGSSATEVLSDQLHLVCATQQVWGSGLRKKETLHMYTKADINEWAVSTLAWTLTDNNFPANFSPLQLWLYIEVPLI